MKRLLLLPILLLLFSCKSGNQCMYDTVIKTSYNYNKTPFTVINSDTLKGCFNVFKDDEKAEIVDSESEFRIELKTNPDQLNLTENDGKQYNWDENTGYNIQLDIVQDTVIVKHLPLNVTDPAILKFGTQYKFFKK